MANRRMRFIATLLAAMVLLSLRSLETADYCPPPWPMDQNQNEIIANISHPLDLVRGDMECGWPFHMFTVKAPASAATDDCRYFAAFRLPDARVHCIGLTLNVLFFTLVSSLAAARLVQYSGNFNIQITLQCMLRLTLVASCYFVAICHRVESSDVELPFTLADEVRFFAAPLGVIVYGIAMYSLLRPLQTFRFFCELFYHSKNAIAPTAIAR